MASFWRCIVVGFLCALTVVSSGSSYHSVSVDSAKRLQIELDSGRVIKLVRLKGQVAFGDPAVSPDHRTVGWLVIRAIPTSNSAEFAGELALYRSGRIIHRFAALTFWDWQFQDSGKRVAYSVGPMHGGATDCILRDVDSGKVVATWSVKDGENPPAWAQSLRV
jgi:hypothetical protein